MESSLVSERFDFQLGSESATRLFTVLLPSGSEAGAARNAPGIPALRESHPSSPDLVVSDIVITPLLAGVTDEVKVEVRYQPLERFAGSEYSYESKARALRPWERRALWRISGLKRETDTDFYYGDDAPENPLPNTNSAGDLLYPPMTAVEQVRLMEFEFAYAATQSPVFLDTITGTLNRNEMTLLGRTGVRCFYLENANYALKFYLDPETVREIPYFEVKLAIQYRPEGFGIRQIDMGLRHKPGGILTPVLEPDSEMPVTAPVKLDGNGVAYDPELQANPLVYTLLNERRFYRDSVWKIPGLPEKENIR